MMSTPMAGVERYQRFEQEFTVQMREDLFYASKSYGIVIDVQEDLSMIPEGEVFDVSGSNLMGITQKFQKLSKHEFTGSTNKSTTL